MNKLQKLLKLAAPRKSENNLVVDLQRVTQSMYRREIDDWRTARYARYSIESPRTYLLQQAYTDAMIDAHLTANIENRILRVTNKEFVIKNKNGDIDSDKTKLLGKQWFGQLIRYAVESIFYGYSLLWIKEYNEQLQNFSIQHIDRQHVIPERGIIVKSISDDTGLPFADYPNNLIYLQLNDSIGLLEKIVPLAILKRHSWANWDDFEQLFGIPIRVAKTQDPTAGHIAKLTGWLQRMGTSAYAVLPKSVDIEIKENNRADAYEVFLKKIEAVNTEISKLINGQTMTMDNGSSRSQSETHLQTQTEITNSDITKIENWFNESFIYTLRNYGLPFADGDYLDIYEKQRVTASAKILIDKVLLENGYTLDKDYLQSTYDTVIDKTPQTSDKQSLSFFD